MSTAGLISEVDIEKVKRIDDAVNQAKIARSNIVGIKLLFKNFMLTCAMLSLSPISVTLLWDKMPSHQASQ